ncbi:MAG: nucleotide exchange factor GrpE [Desulfobacteraceae bacterium 4572_87]|nr:MAG: nucleotide exchange factor GrpE [Desulfobacteraceae bacterium 4572_87]
METDIHMKGVSGNPNNTYATNDTYATWGAMTALTQEVKLQGRAFRELKNDLAPLSTLGSTLGPTLDNLSAAHRDAVSDAGKVADLAHTVLADRKKALKTEADLRARNEVLNVLLDTRERLIIGLKSTEESRLELESGVTKNWFRKRRAGKKADIMQAVDIILSLKKGYRLGLERLDETILKWGVAEIPCQGKPFDPNVMTAVDMEEREDILDGTVLEVFRTGYTLNHETLRPAQVKVARAPMNPKEKI